MFILVTLLHIWYMMHSIYTNMWYKDWGKLYEIMVVVIKVYWDRQDTDQQSQFNDYHRQRLTNQGSHAGGVNIIDVHTELHPRFRTQASAWSVCSLVEWGQPHHRLLSQTPSFNCGKRRSSWTWSWQGFCSASSSCWTPPLLLKVSRCVQHCTCLSTSYGV